MDVRNGRASRWPLGSAGQPEQNRPRLLVPRMSLRRHAGLLVLVAFSLILPATVFAHGASIEYIINISVELRATYDSGEPMAGAQVVVYAPDDPSTPWQTGVCDEDGRFTFTPESSKPGTWDVQVRQAGHGDIVHVPVGTGMPTAGGTGFAPLQMVLAAAVGIWGFVGTALFFSRRRA